MPDDYPPEPWLSFLRDIDDLVAEETHLHCLGGFVVTTVYGSERTTSDLDSIVLTRKDPRLFDLAAEGSQLHRKHKVYLDPVGIAPLPENYEDRLDGIFSTGFKHLRLFALDPYDIALSKIERNTTLDRDDVLYLARVVSFDLELLSRRYHDELRVYLGNPEREDLTLKLWFEMIREDREG